MGDFVCWLFRSHCLKSELTKITTRWHQFSILKVTVNWTEDSFFPSFAC